MMDSDIRIEKDTMGEVNVPCGAYYGAQSARSLMNFPIGKETFSDEFIKAFVILKKACAFVNKEAGVLSEDCCSWIVQACDEIIDDNKFLDQFPLSIWQTGSGTQTNMNVNEVIANRAIEISGGTMGSKDPVHPNDHVNKSQSSNDTFPTAMHIAVVSKLKKELIPAIDLLIHSFDAKQREFSEIIKVGRTHLMDATPISLGQEFSAFVDQIELSKDRLSYAMYNLHELAIGGTAVGTGLNAPEGYGENVAKKISELTDIPFLTACNKFSALASRDSLVQVSSMLKIFATSLFKIVNDIRWMGSGPRCGLAELILPSNEPGSSIMPGKVNPTQCEAVSMIVAQVIGNDVTVSFSNASGNFQLNVYGPVIIHNILQSIQLLTDGCNSFRVRCLDGLQANVKVLENYSQRSLMLATALNNHVGYDKAASIVKKAYEDNISLKEANHILGIVDETKIDDILDPSTMIGNLDKA